MTRHRLSVTACSTWPGHSSCPPAASQRSCCTALEVIWQFCTWIRSCPWLLQPKSIPIRNRFASSRSKLRLVDAIPYRCSTCIVVFHHLCTVCAVCTALCETFQLRPARRREHARCACSLHIMATQYERNRVPRYLASVHHSKWPDP